MRIVCVNQDPGISPGRSKGAAVHLEAMRRAFRDLGATVVEVDGSDDAAARLETSRNQGPVDLVYERYALARPAAAEFARRHRIPFVVEVNSPLAEEAARFRGYRAASGDAEIDRYVLESATAVIAVSTPVAEYAVARGAAADRVHVLPNGVDSDVFHPAAADAESRRRYVPSGRFVVGFHGRLRPWHGFGRLISACDRLLAEGAPLQLMVVGRGDIAASLLGTAVARHATVIGWQPHERVGAYVSLFDALPLTYGGDQPFYFSPLKLAEAMACGVVPVVPALGDLQATVGEAGLVYPAGDEDGLVAALRLLIDRPDERRRLGRLSVERARDLSWGRIADLVISYAGLGRTGGTRRASSGGAR